MPGKLTYGVGAHEPIWHRLRTGNTTAEEWARWQRETSVENLDLLEQLGVSEAHIACTKGFGLEYEKPVIERAARFAEAAGRRSIATSIYVQGFPVYYETFLLERPEAADWLARNQQGDFIPWGGQTFRRWMDPTRREFCDYQRRLLEHVLRQFAPAAVYMDNTLAPACYSDSCRESFREYLRRKYQGTDSVRQFGIASFEAVDLPRFDPVYYPRDAYRVVKDPLLQEWARWRSAVMKDFLLQMREVVRQFAPQARFSASAGCDMLRYNHLFNAGVDLEDLLTSMDGVGSEESLWRPGAAEESQDARRIVRDERHPDLKPPKGRRRIRVSTDSRWWKICSHYGMGGHHGFWGEADRAGKLVALSHNLTFARQADHLGIVGPLAAQAGMLDDIADVLAWGGDHLEVLTGRQQRIAPVGVWRSTSTIGFIRHRPVWEACAVEQMLYEQHLPFTILLDGVLEKFLAASVQGARRKVLVLPGTACVSDGQVKIIGEFVRGGGGLLLLGAAGTRDERTRLRGEYAFAGLFGEDLPGTEFFGPPHWVPELDFSAMPEKLSARCGEGKVTLIREVLPRTELDLTRDPYMPERQVSGKDIVPPANEAVIMRALDDLLGDCLRVHAPRWTLCEYWRRGADLLVCCANLRRRADGGPLAVDLGPYSAGSAVVHQLLKAGAQRVPVRKGKLRVPSLRHFCAIELTGALR